MVLILISPCVALIGIVGGFFGGAALFSVAFPLKTLLFSSTFQNMLLWPAIVLTLGIPVIAIIWGLARIIFGLRLGSYFVGFTLLFLWIVGVFCAVGLGVSVTKDFRIRFSDTEELTINQQNETLVLRRAKGSVSSRHNGIITINGNNLLDGLVLSNKDSLMIKAVRLSIKRSLDSNFHVRVLRSSRGRSVTQANHYVNSMDYHITQKDSVLFIPDRFRLLNKTPYRGQYILLKISVPEGKHIEVKDNLDELLNDSSHWGNWKFHTESGIRTDLREPQASVRIGCFILNRECNTG